MVIPVAWSGPQERYGSIDRQAALSRISKINVIVEVNIILRTDSGLRARLSRIFFLLSQSLPSECYENASNKWRDSGWSWSKPKRKTFCALTGSLQNRSLWVFQRSALHKRADSKLLASNRWEIWRSKTSFVQWYSSERRPRDLQALAAAVPGCGSVSGDGGRFGTLWNKL